MEKFTFEEINLTCCYKAESRADVVAAMTSAIPYMEKEIQELTKQTIVKLYKLTEEEFTELFSNTVAEEN